MSQPKPQKRVKKPVSDFLKIFFSRANIFLH
nr:MAG TPA: hypothetical protein [Caudoviricetes sp.]